MVQVFSGVGDGPAHAARLGIAGQGQGAPLAAFPGLEQGMGKQRQCAGLVADLAEDQVHQTRLKGVIAERSRPFDRPAQLGGAHRTDIFLAAARAARRFSNRAQCA